MTSPGRISTFGFAFALRPTETRRHDQRLAAGMGVPRRARAGFEGDESTVELRRARRLKQGIDADSAGKVLGRPFDRRLRTVALEFHGVIPCFWRLHRYAPALLVLISKNGMWL